MVSLFDVGAEARTGCAPRVADQFLVGRDQQTSHPHEPSAYRSARVHAGQRHRDSSHQLVRPGNRAIKVSFAKCGSGPAGDSSARFRSLAGPAFLLPRLFPFLLRRGGWGWLAMRLLGLESGSGGTMLRLVFLPRSWGSFYQAAKHLLCRFMSATDWESTVSMAWSRFQGRPIFPGRLMKPTIYQQHLHPRRNPRPCQEGCPRKAAKSALCVAFRFLLPATPTARRPPRNAPPAASQCKSSNRFVAAFAQRQRGPPGAFRHWGAPPFFFWSHLKWEIVQLIERLQ